MPDETTLTAPAPPDSAAEQRDAARAAVTAPARLAAARATGLLDAGTVPAFDRLTRLAAKLVRAPAAFVSVVDEDRDVYVSAVGFDEPLATARELTGETFCHFTVAEATPETPLVIDDTAAHPTFRDVPTVKSLGVAAYMGVPLVVGNQSVGALCVIDTRPRDWSADEIEVMRELGASARRELELRAALAESQRYAAERERLVLALRASEARLRSIFEQAPIAVAVLEGPEHVYSIVSPRYAESPGGGRPLLGRPVREAFPEVDGTGFFEIMDRVYQTGEPYFASERRVSLYRGSAEPEERYLDVGYQPLRDADGRTYAIVSATYDVTDQVRARREVELAREGAEAARREAEKANRARADFLAVMSHELRTPLNAIGGYAELMEMGVRGPVNEAQQTDLQRIQRSQRHLLGLVNEVLNYAKLEAGSIRYDILDVPLRRTLADAEGLVTPQAQARGLALAVSECAPDLLVRADQEKLRQVLVNLLSNAVKFTERGGVRVEVAAEGECVRVRVHDSGIGIPPDKLEAVFDPFVQVDTRLTRESQGTGLGLAISRELARGMGGDLSADSEVGRGSTFTLTLARA